MLDLTFLSELSEDELENIAYEARREVENRKRKEQSMLWNQVMIAIGNYFEKGYSLKLKMWCEDYTVNSSDWYPEEEIGVLNFEGES